MITQFQDNLYLITLPVEAPGFDDFIGAWVYLGGPTALIDVGPAATVDRLLSALTELGVKHPDVILLTHIHIDHAGGLGTVARSFPSAPVVCHPKAVNHLVDPAKLWKGSLKTLGDLALTYGEMQAVPARQVVSVEALPGMPGMAGIQAIQSPGHAPHHISYLIGDLLFAGEAGGVCLSLPSGKLYLRPATPPRFLLEISIGSIDALLAAVAGTSMKICYGHVGMQPDAHAMLSVHRRQLVHWSQMLSVLHAMSWEDTDRALDTCLNHLLANDPELNGFRTMPAAVQSRERYFLKNSVRGFWGYLDTLGQPDTG